jgi:replicative DNA helicase
MMMARRHQEDEGGPIGDATLLTIERNALRVLQLNWPEWELLKELPARYFFSDPAHRWLYERLLERRSMGQETNGDQLRAEIEAAGHPVRVLEEVEQARATGDGVPEYIQILANAASRRVIEQFATLSRTADEEKITRAHRRLVELLDLFRSVVVPVSRVADMTEAQTRFYARQGMPMTTGLDELDALLGGGLLRGEMSVFMALPGVGKSALSVAAANHICKDRDFGGSVLYVSKEMTMETIYARLVARATGVPMMQQRYAVALRNGQELPVWVDNSAGQIDDLRAKIERVDEELAALSIHFMDPRDYPNMSLARIRQEARAFNAQCAAKGRPPLALVVIDYLQVLDVDASNDDNRANVLGRLAQQLREEVAVGLDCHVIANSSVNKGGAGTPEIFMLRDSLHIGHAADNILLLTQDEKTDLSTMDAEWHRGKNIPLVVKGVKTRNSEKGSLATLRYERTSQRIVSFSDEQRMQYNLRQSATHEPRSFSTAA